MTTRPPDDVDALQLWREKLAHFLKEEALLSGGDGRKFEVGKRIQEARQKISELEGSVAPVADRQRRGELTSSSGCWNVPHQRNQYFTGREDVIARLYEALHQEGSAALGQAISGLGGIGKTQTAVEYCYRHREKYQAVLWTRAETEAELVRGLVEIARVLDLPEKDAPEQEQAVQAVQRWLGREESWLLVLDNADTPTMLERFLPTPPRGHVLLTSRAQNFDVLEMAPLKLEVLPAEDALAFLQRRARRAAPPAEEKQAAETLAAEVGYLPLALEQAGAYISLHDSRFSDYLASYHRRRLRLLSKGPLRDYREPVATTWSLNFDQVAATSEAAAEILRLSACLGPDQIPEELLIKGAGELGPALSEALEGAAEDSLVLDELLQPLSRYSLIERDREERTFNVHRMVQEVVKQSLDDPTLRSVAERIVGALMRAHPGSEFAAWALCDRLVPHWREAADSIARLKLESEAVGAVLNQAGFYAHDRARYEEASPLYERALQIREKLLGAEHPDVATSLNNLAMLHQAQGEYATAARLYERSLQIREKLLGAEHPSVATSLNNLASLHKAQGEYATAAPLLERALQTREEVLGSEHPSVATSLNNLAQLHHAQGEYTTAAPLLERALQIWEQVLGSEHPNVATSLNNLAVLHKAQGEYAEAAPLLERALQIREEVLGSEHPNVARSLNNLAMLHKAQGEYAEAAPLLERALQIREEVLGSEHPDVATSLNDLAMLHKAQGEYVKAAPLLERGLQIFEEVLGSGHPNVATSLNDLALLHQAQGEYATAAPLLERSLQIYEESLGAEHPSVATSLNNLALLHQAQGGYATAAPLYERSLQILGKVLGPEHPDIATVRENYSSLQEAIAQRDT